MVIGDQKLTDRAAEQVTSIRRPITDVMIAAVRNGSVATRPDSLATEEPMEIRIHGQNQEPVPITTTMRTPGSDFELAAGLLYSEGLLRSTEDVRAIRYCDNLAQEEQLYNVVTVELTGRYDNNHRPRNFISTSACGVCGTTAIEDLFSRCSYVGSSMTVDIDTLLKIPGLLRQGQRLFSVTGGLHCAGIFDIDGNLESIREDIGRHNALDKVIGRYFLEKKLPLSNKILGLSGRIGFELVQKAAMAQIPVIVAISAPSSLAVKTAEGLGVTLVGFTHDASANIYTHGDRIKLPATAKDAKARFKS